jgi:hypothetical protein
LFLETRIANGFRRKGFPFDGKPSFSVPAGRFFQKRPGSQPFPLNDPQVEMRSSGPVLMDYVFGDHGMYPALAPTVEMCQYFELNNHGHPS